MIDERLVYTCSDINIVCIYICGDIYSSEKLMAFIISLCSNQAFIHVFFNEFI